MNFQVSWEKIDEMKHGLERLRAYQTDTILRLKISVDTLKEIDELLEKIILEIKDE